MDELFQKVIVSLSQDSLYDKAKKEWMILFKENKAIDCICGHKVKHCSIIYNRINGLFIEVGTTCCKKYGITEVCTNPLFLKSVKKYMESNDTNMIDDIKLECIIISNIEEEYNRIFEKTELSNEYYRIVPLNRLLIYLTDLHINYHYPFMTYISEIKSDIELLEQKNIIQCDIYCNEDIKDIDGIRDTFRNDDYVEKHDDDDDLVSEISLLSLESELESIDCPKITNLSISDLKLQIYKSEMETRHKLENVSRMIYKNEVDLKALLHRIDNLRNNVNKVKVEMKDFTNKINTFPL